MSTGLDCYFKEEKTDSGFEWFLFLEQDWGSRSNPEYDKSGPFKSFAVAEKYLRDNFANPGGYMVNPHPESDAYDRHCLKQVQNELAEAERRFSGDEEWEPYLIQKRERAREEVAYFKQKLDNSQKV